MKVVYLTILVVIAAVIGIFVWQNIDHQLGLKFLQWEGNAPAAIVILLVYIAGAATGAALFTFVRRAVNKITADPTPPTGTAEAKKGKK